MRICIIGKFPPIEGGVSMRTYWTAYALAARGHDAHVVTNAEEVRAPFRMHMRPQDWERCAPKFASGAVTVHWTDSVDGSQSHIPMANPFVAKLATLAANVHAAQACDVILSHGVVHDGTGRPRRDCDCGGRGRPITSWSALRPAVSTADVGHSRTMISPRCCPFGMRRLALCASILMLRRTERPVRRRLSIGPRPPAELLVVFGRCGGECRDPLMVDGFTAQVLELCDGTRTAGTIVEKLNSRRRTAATGRDLRWIEHLFVQGLIQLQICKMPPKAAA
jgi:hypothetical protein